MNIQQCERQIAHAYRTGDVKAYDRGIKALRRAQYDAARAKAEPAEVVANRIDRVFYVATIALSVFVGVTLGLAAWAVFDASPAIDIVPVYLEADRAALNELVGGLSR